MNGYTPTDDVRWTPAEAVAWALGQVDNPSDDYSAMCLSFTSKAYGFGGSGVESAADYWGDTWHGHASDRTPPLGALPCWTGGSSGWGHIAVVVDDGDGHADRVRIASNDIERQGKIDVVPLSQIEESWGLPYKGWAEPCYWAGWGTNPDGPPYVPPSEDDMRHNYADFASSKSRTVTAKTLVAFEDETTDSAGIHGEDQGAVYARWACTMAGTVEIHVADGRADVEVDRYKDGEYANRYARLVGVSPGYYTLPYVGTFSEGQTLYVAIAGRDGAATVDSVRLIVDQLERV